MKFTDMEVSKTGKDECNQVGKDMVLCAVCRHWTVLSWGVGSATRSGHLGRMNWRGEKLETRRAARGHLKAQVRVNAVVSLRAQGDGTKKG